MAYGFAIAFAENHEPSVIASTGGATAKTKLGARASWQELAIQNQHVEGCGNRAFRMLIPNARFLNILSGAPKNR